MDFLLDKKVNKEFKYSVKTKNMIAPKPTKYIITKSNQGLNTGLIKTNNITKLEVDNLVNEYISSTDSIMLIYTLNQIHKSNSVMIVTEESDKDNDNKVKKKIPFFCKRLRY